MRERRWQVGIFGLALLLGAFAALGQKTTAESLFREALMKERAEGSLREAVFRYERIIADFSSDKLFAARAMYQLSQIYGKLRDPRAEDVLARLSRTGIAPYAARAQAMLAEQTSTRPGPFPEVVLDKYYEIGSPDGKYIVYDNRPEPRGIALYRLYLKDLDTGEERLLVDGAGANLSYPVFSHDSRQLAYNFLDTDRNINELRIAQIATGETVRIAIAGFPMGWTNAGEILCVPVSGAPFLMPAKGGTPRKINASGVGYVAITPDGSRLVGEKNRRLVVIDVANGAESPLTRGGGDEARGLISPDGRLVAFAANYEGRWAMYVARFDDGIPVRNPIKLADIPSVGGGNVSSWWTRNGLLAYGTYSRGAHIYRVDIDPKSGRAVDAPVQLTQDAEYNYGPSISPDGRRIAYVYLEGMKSGIALMDSSGANERPLFEKASIRLFWRSPSELLLQNNDEEGKRWTCSLDINTGLLQKVVRGEGAYWYYVPARNEVLHYYPDGGLNASAAELKLRSLRDGTDRVVAKIEHLNPYLAISADGKRIAYSTNRPIPGSNERLSDLSLMSITGEERRTLIPTERGGGGTPFGWSPDGKYLLYGHLGTHVMNVETGESWLLHRETSGSDWGEVDWSPDGTFVAVVKRSGRRDRLAWEGITYDAVMRLLNAR